MKHNFHHSLQNIQQKINTAATKAQTYLESQISQVTDDYVLAIASYALKLAGSSMFTTAFNKLKNDAVVRGNFRVVIGQAYRGLTGAFFLLRIFSVAISVSPHVCFTSDLILISMCLR